MTKKNIIKFILFVTIFITIYSALIEPSLLVVRKYSIENIKNNQSNKTLKLVQITDTQIGSFYGMKKLSDMVDKVNLLNADIVVFTGDLIDSSTKKVDLKDISSNLKRIDANLAKFSIFGNHDYRNNRKKNYEEIMKKSGFKLLVNDEEKIYLDNKKVINIIGLDEILSGNPNFKILENKDSKIANEFNLLLLHEPDLVDKIKINSVDLALSGHTHGGQIRIPFKGALATPPYGRKYTKGFYNIRGNELYVSSGLGSTKLPFRLFNVPEIIEFEISIS